MQTALLEGKLRRFAVAEGLTVQRLGPRQPGGNAVGVDDVVVVHVVEQGDGHPQQARVAVLSRATPRCSRGWPSTTAGTGYDSAPSRLRQLLKALHRQTGRRVVVLVDEYDKPILDALDAPDLARDNRDFLRGLYAVIKDGDADVRFVLLTGVSRFSKVSLFSGLNNLKARGVESFALDGLVSGDALLSSFDVGDVAPEALLFQTGYLTIRAVESRAGKTYYRLGYPNREVRESLNDSLLRHLTGAVPRQAEHGIRAT